MAKKKKKHEGTKNETEKMPEQNGRKEKWERKRNVKKTKGILLVQEWERKLPGDEKAGKTEKTRESLEKIAKKSRKRKYEGKLASTKAGKKTCVEEMVKKKKN